MTHPHATAFLELHQPGKPLLMPNPWDAGSAKLFASLGFHALATTSSGFAATLGRADGGVTREEAIAQAGQIAAEVARELLASGTREFWDTAKRGRRARDEAFA